MGVVRSLPILRWCSRNSAVTTAQIVWLPRSSGPELQHPSRKNPVTGSSPHSSSSPPSTLRSAMPESMDYADKRWWLGFAEVTEAGEGLVGLGQQGGDHV